MLERLDAHFVIGGDGTERPALERMAASLDVSSHVSFVGFQSEDEYPSLYSLADVFAISSPVELQSIVTLEAAASGLPIVAARAGALPEFVRHDHNGLLFPVNDARALADAIISLLKDTERRRALGTNARQIAAQHDFERTVDKYEYLYDHVIYQGVLVPRPAAQPIG